MTPVSDAEAAHLFRHFAGAPALVLGVSGGPDSTALMVLAARWRKRRKSGPKIIAVTVDHGLRPQARREAAEVKRLARELGVDHRTMKWTAAKPTAGLQEKARLARYTLLAAAAQRAGAPFVITAHTRDDQAETMLFRMARGSGLAGLAGMASMSPVPADTDIVLCRPLLEISKERLIATLRARRIAWAEDPSNADPKFTRVRWRVLMPDLAREGMDAARLSVLARRLRRANAALERVVDAVARMIVMAKDGGPIVVPRERFRELPDEIALRLVGRTVSLVGSEGPVELAKLENLMAALAAEVLQPGEARARFRRTLAGAMVTLSPEALSIERAPPRRNLPKSSPKRPAR
jgi:tRNA(Ile)-lysidine synthase